MPPPRTKKPLNSRRRDLITGAMRNTTALELARATKLGRGVIGRIARGEGGTLPPEQVHALAKHLPITVTDILEAEGYELIVDAQRKVPEMFAELYASLTPRSREVLFVVARGLRMQDALEGEPQ